MPEEEFFVGEEVYANGETTATLTAASVNGESVDPELFEVDGRSVAE